MPHRQTQDVFTEDLTISQESEANDHFVAVYTQNLLNHKQTGKYSVLEKIQNTISKCQLFSRTAFKNLYIHVVKFLSSEYNVKYILENGKLKLDLNLIYQTYNVGDQEELEQLCGLYINQLTQTAFYARLVNQIMDMQLVNYKAVSIYARTLHQPMDGRHMITNAELYLLVVNSIDQQCFPELLKCLDYQLLQNKYLQFLIDFMQSKPITVNQLFTLLSTYQNHKQVIAEEHVAGYISNMKDRLLNITGQQLQTLIDCYNVADITSLYNLINEKFKNRYAEQFIYMANLITKLIVNQETGRLTQLFSQMYSNNKLLLFSLYRPLFAASLLLIEEQQIIEGNLRPIILVPEMYENVTISNRFSEIQTALEGSHDAAHQEPGKMFEQIGVTPKQIPQVYYLFSLYMTGDTPDPGILRKFIILFNKYISNCYYDHTLNRVQFDNFSQLSHILGNKELYYDKLLIYYLTGVNTIYPVTHITPKEFYELSHLFADYRDLVLYTYRSPLEVMKQCVYLSPQQLEGIMTQVRELKQINFDNVQLLNKQSYEVKYYIFFEQLFKYYRKSSETGVHRNTDSKYISSFMTNNNVHTNFIMFSSMMKNVKFQGSIIGHLQHSRYYHASTVPYDAFQQLNVQFGPVNVKVPRSCDFGIPGQLQEYFDSSVVNSRKESRDIVICHVRDYLLMGDRNKKIDEYVRFFIQFAQQNTGLLAQLQPCETQRLMRLFTATNELLHERLELSSMRPRLQFIDRTVHCLIHGDVAPLLGVGAEDGALQDLVGVYAGNLLHKIGISIVPAFASLDRQRICKLIIISAELELSQLSLCQYLLYLYENDVNTLHAIVIDTQNWFLYFLKINVANFRDHKQLFLRMVNVYFCLKHQFDNNIVESAVLSCDALRYHIVLHGSVVAAQNLTYLNDIDQIQQNPVAFLQINLPNEEQQRAITLYVDHYITQRINGNIQAWPLDQLALEQKIQLIEAMIQRGRMDGAYYLYVHFHILRYNNYVLSAKYDVYGMQDPIIQSDLNQQYIYGLSHSSNKYANRIRKFLLKIYNKGNISSDIYWRCSGKQYDVTAWKPSNVFDDYMSKAKLQDAQKLVEVLYNNLLLSFDANCNITVAMFAALIVVSDHSEACLVRASLQNYRKNMQFYEYEIINSCIYGRNKYFSEIVAGQRNTNEIMVDCTVLELINTARFIINKVEMVQQEGQNQDHLDASHGERTNEQEEIRKQTKVAKFMGLYDQIAAKQDEMVVKTVRYLTDTCINPNDPEIIKLFQLLSYKHHDNKTERQKFVFEKILGDEFIPIRLQNILNTQYVGILLLIVQSPELFKYSLIQNLVLQIQVQQSNFISQLIFYKPSIIRDSIDSNKLDDVKQQIINQVGQYHGVTFTYYKMLVGVAEQLAQNRISDGQIVRLQNAIQHPLYVQRSVTGIKINRIPSCMNLVIIYTYYYTVGDRQQEQTEVLKIVAENPIKNQQINLIIDTINDNLNSSIFSCLFEHNTISKIPIHELLCFDHEVSHQLFTKTRNLFLSFGKAACHEKFCSFLMDYQDIKEIFKLISSQPYTDDLRDQLTHKIGCQFQQQANRNAKPLNYISYLITNKLVSFQQLSQKLSIPYLLSEVIFHNKHNYAYALQHLQTQFVMNSIITAVLGISDRHLDNIGVSYPDFDVVHLDIERCFFSGVMTACPEIVPFRFTRIFQEVYRNMQQFRMISRVLHRAMFGRYPIQLGGIIVSGPLLDYVKSIMNEYQMFDKLIDDAVNVENLSRMFIGWMAMI